MRIAVLDYGTGNLRSVARAIEHVGGKPEVTADADTALEADALVVPGVGHFGTCMRNLRARGLDRTVHAAAASGRPLFGVCVGMQVLFEGSEEDDAAGLGLLPGMSRRLPREVTVPHMGWNTLERLAPHPFLDAIPDDAWFYFVHSYAPDVTDGVTLAASEHGRRFSAVVARGNVFATQFHPEKSGDAGLAIYEAFVREAGS